MKKRKQQFIPLLMDQIGEVIEYRSGKKTKPVIGTVVGIRHSAKTIMNMKTFKEFPAAEEAFENYWESLGFGLRDNITDEEIMPFIEAFISGTKWQSEQDNQSSILSPQRNS